MFGNTVFGNTGGQILEDKGEVFPVFGKVVVFGAVLGCNSHSVQGSVFGVRTCCVCGFAICVRRTSEAEEGRAAQGGVLWRRL